jgi:hypothetical protein
MKMNEEWRNIKDYEGYYQISNLGNVKSLHRVVARRNHPPHTTKEKILALTPDSKGYFIVYLHKGIRKGHLVHKLVWDAFGNETKKDKTIRIDHKDDNRQNNKIDNLQLLANRENCYKGWVAKGKKEPIGVTLDRTKKKYVANIQLAGRRIFLGTYNNIEEASKKYQDTLLAFNGTY